MASLETQLYAWDLVEREKLKLTKLQVALDVLLSASHQELVLKDVLANQIREQEAFLDELRRDLELGFVGRVIVKLEHCG
jgi:citrate lyase beta subunit